MFSLYQSDKPNKPSLSDDTMASPTDGDNIVLTCTTSSPGITGYEFYKGETSLGKTTSNTHTIKAAAIGVDDDSYTCVAYLKTIASDVSNVHSISCKSNFNVFRVMLVYLTFMWINSLILWVNINKTLS